MAPDSAPSFYELPPQQPVVSVSSSSLVNRPKILIHLETGRRFFVAGGLSWKKIVEQICQDGTNPRGLYNVARGEAKTANGWTIEWAGDEYSNS